MKQHDVINQLFSRPEPPPLTQTDRDMISGLGTAVWDDEMCGVSAIRRSDNQPVVLICGCKKKADGAEFYILGELLGPTAGPEYYLGKDFDLQDNPDYKPS